MDLDTSNLMMLAWITKQRERERAGKGPGGSKHIGRTRRRVARILSEQLGHKVDPHDVRPTVGGTRTNKTHDVYLWEATLSRDHKMYQIVGCFKTMSDFVKGHKDGWYIEDGEIFMGKRQ